MSEFTDYMQLQTSAETLSALEAQIVQSVGSASLPLYELSGDAGEDRELAEAVWAGLAKPHWIMIGTDGTLEQLAQAGPAYHHLVEEDFATWSVTTYLDGEILSLAFLADPASYREATLRYAATQVYDPAQHGEELARLARYFGVDSAALHSTFLPDGGESFSALIGARYEQMEDLSSPDLAPGQVELGVLSWFE
ncbi:hypothetical protein FHY55_05885 [Oceanicola sp. D3]|uniref:hypothetical protein n=1 Tax=Oceanicola sp. D3 TaxID=2587163 RepID=UPI0011206F13|nr:hypothetical protein [Oceanicola sp. D3]QDC08795.1 hypothetical protein FHY55_05885 [Oceanicola sp. D3]